MPDTLRSFMQDLAGRLANRVQLTSDGHRAYLTAVEDAFGANVDYAMLVSTTVTRRRASGGTAQPFAPERRRCASPETLTRTTSAPATSSVTT